MTRQTKRTREKTVAKDEIVTAYKGFDKNMSCRGYQFEVGKTYEHTGSVEACASGFHACENPLDVWGYYGVFENRFAVVELSGELSRHSGDSKIAGGKITIKAELSLGEFINTAVDKIWQIVKPIDGKASKNKIGSSGYSAQIGSSGNYAQIGSSGNYAQIGSSGYSAQIGSSGNYAQIGSSGYSAQIGSSGYSAQIGSSGDYAQIVSSGDYAQINSSGKKAVIASAGMNAKVKAVDGAWISLAEFDNDGNCVGFATGKVGKNGINADAWYCVKNGNLVECEE